MNKQQSDSSAYLKELEKWRKAVRQSDLHSTAKVVLHALQDYQNRGSRTAWPSQELLAKECGISRTQVNKWLKEAENYGFIACVGLKSSRGQYGSKVYQFLIPPETDRVKATEQGKPRTVLRPPDKGHVKATEQHRVKATEHKPTNEPLNSKPPRKNTHSNGLTTEELAILKEL